jgi:hypothetical protein
MNHRDTSSGGIDGTTVNLYGYWLPLNNTKVARSITLPNNNNVEVLAMSLVNTPLPAPLAAAFNRAGIYTDGSTFPSTTDWTGGAIPIRPTRWVRSSCGMRRYLKSGRPMCPTSSAAPARSWRCHPDSMDH